MKVVYRNGRKDERKNAYGGNWEWIHHLEYGFSNMSVGGPPLESSQLTQDKT